MKTLLVTLVTVAFGLIALPQQADARPYHIGHSYTYVSGHTSCGCPIYKRRVITGYDCYHRPIYRYYSVPVVHRCRSHYKSPYYRGNHYKYNNHRYRGSYHRNHYRSRHYSRGSVSYRGRYSRGRSCR